LIDQLFYSALCAPGYTKEALTLLAHRRTRVILEHKETRPRKQVKRSLLSGIATQDLDQGLEPLEQWQSVTKRIPSPQEEADLIFAQKAVKHLKSNAIALVKDSQLIGMGCGQPSRIDALNQAIEKAQRYGFTLKGAVMASDAFFPFSDCVTRAAEVGVHAILQPGGSRRDEESVRAADDMEIAMVMTGVRHFKH